MASRRPRSSSVDAPLQTFPLALPPCVLQMLLTRHGLSGRDLVALLRSGLVARRDLAAAAQHAARRLPSLWVTAASATQPWPEAYALLDDLARFIAPAPATLCACGANGAGQTGLLPPALTPVVTLRRVPGLTRAIHVAAGMAHSLLVTVDGSLYAAGANFVDGRLGLGRTGSGDDDSNGTMHAAREISDSAAPNQLLPSTGADAGSPLFDSFVSSIASSSSSSSLMSVNNIGSHLGITAANNNIYDGNNSTPHADVDNQVDNQSDSPFAESTASDDDDDDETNAQQDDDSHGVEFHSFDDANSMPLRTPSMPFTRVPLPRHHVVVQCAAGGKHSLALTIAGVVLAAGDNSRGQLGFADRVDRPIFAAPPLPPGAGKIVQIAAGAAHSVLLSESGHVFVSGENRNSQLGLGRSAGLSRASFVEVGPLPELAGQVAAGEEHTLIVSKSGRALYGAGLNCAGQLGDGSTCDRPIFMRLLCELLSMQSATHGPAASVELSPSLTSSSSSTTTTSSSSGRRMTVGADGPEVIASVSAGGSHSLVVTSWGRLLAAGECLFRHGEQRPRNAFGEVATAGVLQAAAGWSHSVAVAGLSCLIAVVGDNPYADFGSGAPMPPRGRFGRMAIHGTPVFAAAGGAHTLLLVTKSVTAPIHE